MENPFELILERLDRIEKAITKLNLGAQIAEVNHPMDVKELTACLKNCKSTIYAMTASNKIPHYKSGKRLYFKQSEIDEWMFSNKIKTNDDIEREAMEYIRKNPRR